MPVRFCCLSFVCVFFNSSWFFALAFHCENMHLDLCSDFCIELNVDVCCFGLGSESRTLAC